MMLRKTKNKAGSSPITVIPKLKILGVDNITNNENKAVKKLCLFRRKIYIKVKRPNKYIQFIILADNTLMPNNLKTIKIGKRTVGPVVIVVKPSKFLAL
jgi:hypothetical protein